MAIYNDRNEVHLLGGVIRFEYTEKEEKNSYMNITLVTNKSVRKNEEWENVPSYHKVIVFGKNAQYLNDKLSKGDKLLIVGELQYSEYEKEGVKKYSTSIIAKEVNLFARSTKGTDTADTDNSDIVDSTFIDPFEPLI